MQIASQSILIILGSLFVFGFGVFGIVSLLEQEKRATIISFLFCVGSAAFFGLLVVAPYSLRIAVLVLCLVIFAVSLLLYLLPIGRVDRGEDTPKTRFDERDVIFSRFFRIREGSPEFDSYYKMRPEKKATDDLTRTKPGLNAPGSQFYHSVLAAAVDSSFFLTEALSGDVDGPLAENKASFDVREITQFVKDLTRYYGALDAGITPLRPYHVYSHNARGPGAYGERLTVEHKFAIAFTVEMSHAMIGSNPRLQGSMESAHQYVEAARVAVRLAAFIRALGYPARAHIDGNYRLICPLVARDAGLGEIGRMGLLMTPTHGPRVRLAVVTTDLELLPDDRNKDDSVIDFCTLCKKCATNCPSRSISFDDRQEIEGTLRWRIDSDTCYRYWTVSGTDCGRCMTVCPYSHPHSFAHNIVRHVAKHSGFARRVILFLDDFFYGRKPDRRPEPGWTKIEPITGEH